MGSDKSYAAVTKKNMQESEERRLERSQTQTTVPQTTEPRVAELQAERQPPGNEAIENVSPAAAANFAERHGTRRGNRAGFFRRRKEAEERVARLLGHLMNMAPSQRKRGGRGREYDRGRGGGSERGRRGGGGGNSGHSEQQIQTQGSNYTRPGTSMEE